MPNWAQGALRIRGAASNLLKFIGDLVVVSNTSAEEIPLKEKLRKSEALLEEGCIEYHVPDEGVLWLEGSERLFFEGGFRLKLPEKDPDAVVSIALNIEQAWGVDANILAEHSGKYHLEMKIMASEPGMQFYQDIYVKHGEIVKDETVQCDDWVFDSIFPPIGG